MSGLAIVLIVVAVVLALLFAGGLVANRRREALRQEEYERHVAEADQALEQARAADKGWDRAVMDETARRALERERPGWLYEHLHLVLVDDRPGVTEDRARYAAVSGGDEVRLVIARRDAGWMLDHIE